MYWITAKSVLKDF